MSTQLWNSGDEADDQVEETQPDDMSVWMESKTRHRPLGQPKRHSGRGYHGNERRNERKQNGIGHPDPAWDPDDYWRAID